MSFSVAVPVKNCKEDYFIFGSVLQFLTGTANEKDMNAVISLFSWPIRAKEHHHWTKTKKYIALQCSMACKSLPRMTHEKREIDFSYFHCGP